MGGVHAQDFPNMYMMIGPQALNPLTNVTLVAEDQARYIAQLVKYMRQTGATRVEPTASAVAKWTELCTDTSKDKVWQRCGNWYMKTTKDDQQKGREASSHMWMDTYE